MFVSGHLDGCLAFWSLEDGDMPVLVRTMERDDVLKFDWGQAELETDQLHSTSDQLHPKEEPVREPIFRIAWSAFPSGSSNDGTLLTVLGGLMTGDPIGVHVLHLPNSQLPKDSNSQHRDYLRASTAPIGHSIYFTNETPEDFLLIPKKNPYFDGSFDPISIIISTGANFDIPKHFSTVNNSNGFKHQSLSDRTLRSFSFPPKLNEEVQENQLPGAFDWIGSNTVIASEIFELTEDSFRKLCDHTSSDHSSNKISRLPLKGGKATVSPSFFESDHHEGPSAELINEFKQKFRVMVTIHMNKKIKFWDFSIRLLLPNKNPGLQTEFPARLDHLTIDLNAFTNQMSTLSTVHKLDHHPIGVFLSSESLDLVLTFPDHDVLVFSYHQAEFVEPQVTDGDQSDEGPYRLSMKINDLSPTFPVGESDTQASGSGANGRVSTSKEQEDVVKGLSTEEVTIPTTSITEPEPEENVALEPDGIPKPSLEPITTNPIPDQASEQLPLESPLQAISSRSTSPVINKSSQPPPPRPPRSVRRVNETSRSRSRPNTPDISRIELTPVATPVKAERDRVTVTVGIDLSEIQETYQTRTGFRPVMWVPSSKRENQQQIKSAIDVTEPNKNHHQHDELIVGLSDMGFLAVAQIDQSQVKVYDLRNMKILFDDHVGSSSNNGGKGKEKEKVLKDGKKIKCLRWIVSALYTDALTLPRLLVGYEDGSFDTLKLYLSQSHMIDSWTATALSNDSFTIHDKKHIDNNSPIACFVFDGNGQLQLTNLSKLRDALSDGIRHKPITTVESNDISGIEDEDCKNVGSILVIVSKVSVVVRIKINGPIVVKKEDFLGDSTNIVQARIISYQKSFALLLIDEKRSCYVLSLPHLDLICKTFLPVLHGLDTLGRLSIDSSADVVEQVDFTTTHLTTLLLGRDSAYIPHITTYDHTIRCPDPPQPRNSGLAATVASNLVSWFQQATTNTNQTGPNIRVTGLELDSILAGPNRPEKRKSALQPPRNSQSKPTVISGVNSSHQQRKSGSSSIISNSKDQMSKNVDQLEERGEKLDHLNERFEELSNASSQLVQQAKRIGQQQSAKAAFSSGLSGVKSFFK